MKTPGIRKAGLMTMVVAVFSLTACHTPDRKPPPSEVIVDAAPAPQPPMLTQREVGDALYEMAWSSTANALFVAGAQSAEGGNGGVIYRLDPVTLEITGQTQTDLKNFATTQSDIDGVFYTTNTLEGGVSKVDAQSGLVLKSALLKGRSRHGDPAGAHKVLRHQGDLFVGRIADPAFISVVDANTLAMKTQIRNAGKWITGLLHSPLTKRLYAANGSGEILVVNPNSYQIEQRWTPGDNQTHLLLNMAEDPATGRLFVIDDSPAKAILVFDEYSGKVINRLEGDALDIKFNAGRNEIYLSQRASKRVLQLDATTYALKNSWSFDLYPDSLLLTPDGNVLYVTLKQQTHTDAATQGPDRVVRIAFE